MNVTGPVIANVRQRPWWWAWLERQYAIHIRYWIPHLVWRGQEVDVRITFTEDRLRGTAIVGDHPDYPGAIRQLNCGALPEIEHLLAEIGISFDRGLGLDGRDWEWDYSLSGPIHVTFVRRAQKPEKRR